MWIEIGLLHSCQQSRNVTPFAGVWIEIQKPGIPLPRPEVTPFAGVWIEIECIRRMNPETPSHSLRGSVD